ncbi:restriction endonuclease subunit S [Proteus vulgaris]|uniref:restriction endonuclease subunit S n=1 Tax=Proteus vulgaris TaxID=585 RepID=UPI0013D3EE77|nr:restriction endonuclease subunit S [Proteus vulgaris]
MTKYKAYPEYKDSGVEWLGEIPADWEMLRHKYVASFTKGRNPISLFEQSLKNTLPYLSMECLRNNITDKYALISNDIRIAVEGQPLIIWDGSNAGEFVKGKSGILSSTMAAATLIFPLNPQYYWYLCITIEPEMRKSAIGMGIPHVNGDELKNISFGIPSIHEQKKISSFLDHETAKIDNLIETQQQLIELLKEKRQAVISHAVTKGLNPDVPMKDSGVEWLGEVPGHWEFVPLKYLCNFSGGGTPTKDNLSYWQEGTVPWVSPKDMKSFWISETQDYVTPKAVSESSTNYVDEGSLLMVVRSGILQRNIPVAINIVKVTMNQDMKALKFNERMKAHYAAYFINGNVNSLLLEWTKEGATVESIEHEYLANGLLPVPPIDEQYSIIKSISNQMIRFELLEEKALTGIQLLQERRTALISAAVTGKIDVRDWVAPDSQETDKTEETTA